MLKQRRLFASRYYDIDISISFSKTQIDFLCGKHKPFIIDKIEMLMKRIFDDL